MNNEFKFDTPNNLFNLFTNTIPNLNYYELNQVHSDKVIIVDDNYQNNTIGDAMITIKKNILLVIKTADCIPILLYDKENQALALVHSGWKGTLNSITIKTLNKMIDIYNTNPNNIIVYLYPSIRKCHFEVEEDVYQLFQKKIKNIDDYTTKKENKYYIDLQKIVIDSLQCLGVNQIYDSNICTYCHHDKYHSYRYNHTDKRNYLIAMIKE